MKSFFSFADRLYVNLGWRPTLSITAEVWMWIWAGHAGVEFCLFPLEIIYVVSRVWSLMESHLFGCSPVSRLPNDALNMKLIVAAFVGALFGFSIGLSFPVLSLTKVWTLGFPPLWEWKPFLLLYPLLSTFWKLYVFFFFFL